MLKAMGWLRLLLFEIFIGVVLGVGIGAKRSTFQTIVLTDIEKMEILKIHNKLRRTRYSSDMRYMTWDSELAWVAESYGRKCKYRHNRYRKHTKYSSVGENIYAGTEKASTFDPKTAVRKWFSEKDNFNYYSGTCRAGKVCGHYTQVVWAQTFKVGCALTVCDFVPIVKLRNSVLFICNYATSGNIHSPKDNKLLPVFQIGNACSKCDKGDYCRDSLCANSERDFIKFDDDDDRGYQQPTVYIIVIAALSVVIVILVAWIVFREIRNRSFSIKCCKPKLPMKFWKSCRKNSKTIEKDENPVDNDIPLLPTEKSTKPTIVMGYKKSITVEISDTSFVEERSNSIRSSSGSRISFPKPSHRAPRSPPPMLPAPVLVRD